jgi:enamine deaminase RidA (YjgF/YER057c/UK114 family)
MPLTHLNPESLEQNPVFSQGVLVEGGSLLVVGSQNGINGEGNLVGDDVESQSAPALRNVIAVLEKAVPLQPTWFSSRSIWWLRPTSRPRSVQPRRSGASTPPPSR